MLGKWKKHLDAAGISEPGHLTAMMFCEALLPGVELLEERNVEAYDIKTFIERCVTAVVYRDPASVARRLNLQYANANSSGWKGRRRGLKNR